MKVEKIHKKVPSRIIQPDADRGIYIVDNRAKTSRQFEQINTIQKRTGTNEFSVRSNNNVLQRDAYWSVDVTNKVQNNIPVNVPPHGFYIKRQGDDLNQRLYNKASEAKNAARVASGWHGAAFSSRTVTAGALNGQGYYQYNINTTADAHQIPAGIPLIARHDVDPVSLLTLHHGEDDIQQCRHWHAGTSNEADIHPPASHAAQPIYNLAGNINHYFINPF